MKTKLFTALTSFFFIALSIAQTPSINETNIKDLKKIPDEKLSEEKKAKIKLKKIEITKIESDIKALRAKNNAITTADNAGYDLLKKNTNEIKKLEQKKNNIKYKVENLESYYYNWWLPTSGNSESRDNFFKSFYNNSTDKTHVINSLSLSAYNNGVTAQSEILTDNINWFRVALGTIISAQSNADETTVEQETQEQALTRLFNGGGNLYLEFTLPIATSYEGNSRDWINSYLFFQAKGAADIKGVGNNLEASTSNGSLGFSGYLSASSDNKSFNFFVQANTNYTFGNNDFYQNLNLNNNRGFLNGKIICGATIINKFRISAMINTFGSDEKLRSGKVLFGLQVLQ